MSKVFDICVRHLKKFMPDVLAGEIFFHPYRLKEEVRVRLIQYCKDQKIQEPAYSSGGFWQLARDDVLNLGSLDAYRIFSPHYHILAFGYFPKADDYFYATGGWIYKNVRSVSLKIEQREDGSHFNDVEAVASYIMTHCGIELNEKGKAVKSHRSFGLMSPRYFRLGDGYSFILQSFLLCPECLKNGQKTELVVTDEQGREMIHRRYGSLAEDFIDDFVLVQVVTKIPVYHLHAPVPRPKKEKPVEYPPVLAVCDMR